jgi:hypothetical protein
MSYLNTGLDELMFHTLENQSVDMSSDWVGYLNETVSDWVPDLYLEQNHEFYEKEKEKEEDGEVNRFSIIPNVSDFSDIEQEKIDGSSSTKSSTQKVSEHVAAPNSSSVPKMEMPNSDQPNDFDKPKELIEAKPVGRTQRRGEVSANLYRSDNLQKICIRKSLNVWVWLLKRELKAFKKEHGKNLMNVKYKRFLFSFVKKKVVEITKEEERESIDSTLILLCKLLGKDKFGKLLNELLKESITKPWTKSFKKLSKVEEFSCIALPGGYRKEIEAKI